LIDESTAIERTIRRFLSERFACYRDDLAAYDSLEGIVDSLSLFDLVDFVERKFGARIPDEDFSPARFASIDRILETIREFSDDPGAM